MGRIADVLTSAGLPTSTFSISGLQAVLTGEPGGVGPSQTVLSRNGLADFNPEPSVQDMEDVIKALNGATTSDSGFFAEMWSSEISEGLDKQAFLKAELDKTSPLTAFPEDSSKTGDEFQMVTQIMQTREARGSKRDIFYVDTSGFDTHSEVDEKLISKFTEVNSALTGLVDELKALGLWESTVLVEMSEFGRTLDMNSGSGSDQ